MSRHMGHRSRAAGSAHTTVHTGSVPGIAEVQGLVRTGPNHRCLGIAAAHAGACIERVPALCVCAVAQISAGTEPPGVGRTPAGSGMHAVVPPVVARSPVIRDHVSAYLVANGIADAETGVEPGGTEMRCTSSAAARQAIDSEAKIADNDPYLDQALVRQADLGAESVQSALHRSRSVEPRVASGEKASHCTPDELVGSAQKGLPDCHARAFPLLSLLLNSAERVRAHFQRFQCAVVKAEESSVGILRVTLQSRQCRSDVTEDLRAYLMAVEGAVSLVRLQSLDVPPQTTGKPERRVLAREIIQPAMVPGLSFVSAGKAQSNLLALSALSYSQDFSVLWRGVEVRLAAAILLRATH